MLKIYNTLTRKLEEFRPLRPGKVGLYTCGPTVYDFAHIGNLRTYIFEDILRRVLEYDGFKVRHVMNITDVGHLTSDEDRGEDKLEKGAKREGKSVLDVAKMYTKAFLADIGDLNIKRAKNLPTATGHVKEQIALVQRLMEKDFAYDTDEAVYFDVSRFPGYTRLSGQKLDDKKIGARDEVVTDTSKRNSADFALWFKRVGKFKNHVLHWDSPWGDGFPGWHLECSAMSAKYLGQPFDIHTGGVDHISVHHTNEIAQSEAAYGKPLANYWLHGEFLLIDEGRMGKSQGNFITLSTLKQKGFSPLAYRYLVLSAHWRSNLNFTWESLEAAQNALDNLYEKISEINSKSRRFACADYMVAFEREINNDLDTPRALSLLWRLVKSDVDPGLKIATIKKFDEVLAIDLLNGAKQRKKIPSKIRELTRQREILRQQKDYKQSDKLRVQIESAGYTVKDTPEGPLIRKK